ncbi:hypothetical protein NRB20_20310 [Nocardia sp. RB20]|uniref:Uncharacterized protein n=1 Tax=Nocardia macrotermitis TaxID=2585198 RepID=A0A7K0CZN2_9NOCA|nr:hypothetical protein [Nocardia macrotermitis]
MNAISSCRTVASLEGGRSRERQQAYVLRDEALSEQLERVYDEELDGMLRLRRSVRGRRHSDRHPIREWRNIGLRMHRPRDGDV